jgi:hypothetical protein
MRAAGWRSRRERTEEVWGQQVKLLLNNPQFQDDVNRIRENLDSYRKASGMLSLVEPIRELRSKYRLDANWLTWLGHYIMWGDADPWRIHRCRVVTRKHEETGEDELYIQIYADTTRQDVMDIWQWVEHEQRQLPTYRGERRRLRTNLDRDLFIWQLVRLEHSHTFDEAIKAWNKEIIEGIEELDKELDEATRQGNARRIEAIKTEKESLTKAFFQGEESAIVHAVDELERVMRLRED